MHGYRCGYLKMEVIVSKAPIMEFQALHIVECDFLMPILANLLHLKSSD